MRPPSWRLPAGLLLLSLVAASQAVQVAKPLIIADGCARVCNRVRPIARRHGSGRAKPASRLAAGLQLHSMQARVTQLAFDCDAATRAVSRGPSPRFLSSWARLTSLKDISCDLLRCLGHEEGWHQRFGATAACVAAAAA